MWDTAFIIISHDQNNCEVFSILKLPYQIYCQYLTIGSFFEENKKLYDQTGQMLDNIGQPLDTDCQAMVTKTSQGTDWPAWDYIFAKKQVITSLPSSIQLWIWLTGVGQKLNEDFQVVMTKLWI